MMTTFLEFVCAKLLGPPVNSRGDGQSTWICPLCERPKFHTRPVKFGCKNRYSCWRCVDDMWGDEFDIVRHVKPHLNTKQVYDVLTQWRDEFERGEDPTRDDSEEKLMMKSKRKSNPRTNLNINDNHTYISFSQGETGLDAANIKIMYVYKDPDLPTMQHADGYANSAFYELKVFINNLIIEGHKEALTICAEALRLCANYRLHPGALSEQIDLYLWTTGMAQDHIAHCVDPECDWSCCLLPRLKRKGWSDTKIKKYLQQEREKATARMRKMRKAKRKSAAK